MDFEQIAIAFLLTLGAALMGLVFVIVVVGTYQAGGILAVIGVLGAFGFIFRTILKFIVDHEV